MLSVNVCLNFHFWTSSDQLQRNLVWTLRCHRPKQCHIF